MGIQEQFPQEKVSSSSNVEVEKARDRCAVVAERIDRIQTEHEVDGGSSFRDVTKNLLSIGKRYVAFCEEKFEPQDLEVAEQNLSHLETYLNLLDENPDILEKEISARDGAFPELRNAADAAAAEGTIKRPIVYYIDSIVKAQAEKVQKKAA